MNVIDKATNAFIDWCARDDAGARLQRTVAQGVLAAVVSGVTTGEWGAAFAVALVMAVLSPVQAAIGTCGEDYRGEEEDHG